MIWPLYKDKNVKISALRANWGQISTIWIFSSGQKQGRNSRFSYLGGGKNSDFWPKYLLLIIISFLFFSHSGIAFSNILVEGWEGESLPHAVITMITLTLGLPKLTQILFSVLAVHASNRLIDNRWLKEFPYHPKIIFYWFSRSEFFTFWWVKRGGGIETKDDKVW